MNSNAQPKPYIVAERVCKSFGTHQVLKDVSTVFHTGEVRQEHAAARHQPARAP